MQEEEEETVAGATETRRRDEDSTVSKFKTTSFFTLDKILFVLGSSVKSVSKISSLYENW